MPYCPYCGHQAEISHRFCSECGSNFPESNESETRADLRPQTSGNLEDRLDQQIDRTESDVDSLVAEREQLIDGLQEVVRELEPLASSPSDSDDTAIAFAASLVVGGLLEGLTNVEEEETCEFLSRIENVKREHLDGFNQLDHPLVQVANNLFDACADWHRRKTKLTAGTVTGMLGVLRDALASGGDVEELTGTLRGATRRAEGEIDRSQTTASQTIANDSTRDTENPASSCTTTEVDESGNWTRTIHLRHLTPCQRDEACQRVIKRLNGPVLRGLGDCKVHGDGDQVLQCDHAIFVEPDGDGCVRIRIVESSGWLSSGLVFGVVLGLFLSAIDVACCYFLDRDLVQLIWGVRIRWYGYPPAPLGLLPISTLIGVSWVWLCEKGERRSLQELLGRLDFDYLQNPISTDGEAAKRKPVPPATAENLEKARGDAPMAQGGTGAVSHQTSGADPGKKSNRRSKKQKQRDWQNLSRKERRRAKQQRQELGPSAEKHRHAKTADSARVVQESESQPKQELDISAIIQSLIKLGGAAVGQERMGNEFGYEKIEKQIVEVGQKLMDQGDVGLVDSVYHRFERQAPSPLIIRAVTLAWQSKLSGWSM